MNTFMFNSSQSLDEERTCAIFISCDMKWEIGDLMALKFYTIPNWNAVQIKNSCWNKMAKRVTE